MEVEPLDSPTAPPPEAAAPAAGSPAESPTPAVVDKIAEEEDKVGMPTDMEAEASAPMPVAVPGVPTAEEESEAGAPGSLPIKQRKMLSTQWTVEMDEQLTQAVAKFGEGHWSKIAELVDGRTGKQCRERWKNQISSEVKKGDWTVEEDALIVTCVQELGTKWSEISKRFVGRTDNAIKNRYNSEVRKRERAEQRAVREAAAAEERAKQPQAP